MRRVTQRKNRGFPEHITGFLGTSRLDGRSGRGPGCRSNVCSKISPRSRPIGSGRWTRICASPISRAVSPRSPASSPIAKSARAASTSPRTPPTGRSGSPISTISWRAGRSGTSSIPTAIATAACAGSRSAASRASAADGAFLGYRGVGTRHHGSSARRRSGSPRPTPRCRRMNDELARQNLQFDTALNNMTHGLCMFDGERRLIVCNRRYAEMYELPPELARPGTSYDDHPRASARDRHLPEERGRSNTSRDLSSTVTSAGRRAGSSSSGTGGPSRLPISRCRTAAGSRRMRT